MIRRLVAVIAIAVLAFLILIFIFPNDASEKTPESQDTEPIASQAPIESRVPDLAQTTLEEMTLDEKIAQMLIVNKADLSVSADEQTLLKTAPYGGYILMEGSFGTLAQTRAMVEGLQLNAKTPLIIAIDQEGGAVQRLKNISSPRATAIPNMYSVGQTGDLTYAKTIGRVIAEELRAVGVNVDFAPDADVFSTPSNTVIGRRSFSQNPQVAANMSLALAQGLEQNGVTATYKHFPGHGDTATDSHKNLPLINRTREQLDEVELVPFKNAIANGAQLIMVGHIALPQLTGDNTPATLSPQITTKLLREELGFDGLVVTDGLNMGAVTGNYSDADIYKLAVEAGADLLVLPRNPQLAIETIKQKIPESRIDESVYRILKFKQQLADYQYLDVSYFGSAEHSAALAR